GNQLPVLVRQRVRRAKHRLGNAASAPRRACDGARSGRPLAHRPLALERVEPRSAYDGESCAPPPLGPCGSGAFLIDPASASRLVEKIRAPTVVERGQPSMSRLSLQG